MNKQDGVKFNNQFRNFLMTCLNETAGSDVSVVQVGANDGFMADPLAPVLERYQWGGLLIEPVPRYFGELSKRYAANDKVRTKNFAISESSGVATIYCLHPDQEENYPKWARGLASFDQSHLHRAIKPEHLTSIEVPCYPLSQILYNEGFEGAHVLVVDVEGAEKKVFSSFEWSQFRPLLIEVETRHLPEDEKTWLFRRFHDGDYYVYDFGYDSIAIQKSWFPLSTRILFRLSGLNQFIVEPSSLTEPTQ